MYDVLDALVRRNLAVLRPGRVATFSAVAPELALARLMALQRESMERMDRASVALAAALTPLWAAGQTHTDPLDYIEVLRDPKAIAERFASIQEQASQELLSFCKPPLSLRSQRRGDRGRPPPAPGRGQGARRLHPRGPR